MNGETLIVQPAMPEYRRGFLDRVAQQLPIRVMYSTSSPDGASSHSSETAFDRDVVDCVPLPMYLFWQKGVVASVWRRPPRHLVIGGNPRYLSSVVAALVAKLKGVHITWWGHARSSTSGSFGTWLRTRMMRLADRVLVYYPEEIPLLPRRLQDRAAGLDNSIDTDRIIALCRDITDDQLAGFVARNGIAQQPLLITLGRLTRKARADRVIRALAELRQSGSDARLAFVGDGPERQALETLAGDLGVAEAVIWAGEVLDEHQLAMWMRSACLFVYGGAVGLSLIHAFAYGLPAVISSDPRDHNPEALLFVDGEFGAAFDADAAESLATVLRDLLGDERALAAMGQAAQEMVASRLGIDRMADRFVAAVGGEPGSTS